MEYFLDIILCEVRSDCTDYFAYRPTENRAQNFIQRNTVHV